MSLSQDTILREICHVVAFGRSPVKVKGSDGVGASFVEIQFYLGLSGFGIWEGAGVGLLVSGGSPDSTDKGLKG